MITAILHVSKYFGIVQYFKNTYFQHLLAPVVL